MKSNSILSLALLSALTAGAFAQGSLTPPAGAPAPVMKTLQEVYDKAATAAAAEARTPLVAGQTGVTINAAGTISISQSGSYYLTGNHTVTTAVHGIAISASDVTLDLNGFTIRSTAPTTGGLGIALTNINNNVTIRNGHIRGSVTYNAGTDTYSGGGFAGGVDDTGSILRNIHVSDLSVQGCVLGIDLTAGVAAEGNLVERCLVKTVSSLGISASIVSHSSANETGNTAIIGQTVSHCSARSTGGSGISADVVENCRGIGSNKGINATFAVTNSYGEGTSADAGIVCSGTVSFSRGKSASGFAISSAIAIGCTTAGGTINSAQKHLGTP